MPFRHQLARTKVRVTVSVCVHVMKRKQRVAWWPPAYSSWLCCEETLYVSYSCLCALQTAVQNKPCLYRDLHTRLIQGLHDYIY